MQPTLYPSPKHIIFQLLSQHTNLIHSNPTPNLPSELVPPDLKSDKPILIPHTSFKFCILIFQEHISLPLVLAIIISYLIY
jgi:hypothetical protein